MLSLVPFLTFDCPIPISNMSTSFSSFTPFKFYYIVTCWSFMLIVITKYITNSTLARGFAPY